MTALPPALTGLVAALWTAVAVLDGVEVGEMSVMPRGAAAAAGAALLAAARAPRAGAGGGPGGARTPADLVVPSLALVALPLTLALAMSGDSPGPMAVVLVVMGAAGASARDARSLVGLAAGLLLAGVAVSEGALRPGSDGAGVLAALATGGLAVAGGPSLAVAAAVAVVAGPVVPAAAAALAGTAAALGAAWWRRPSAALLLVALAAATVPAARPGAALLAAAAVVVEAVGVPAAVLTALPGGVAVAIALAGAELSLRVLAVAVGAAAVATLLAHRAATDDGPLWPDRAALPAAVAGAWLFLAPSTWRWAGADALGRVEGLEPFTRGAALAAAVGGLTLVASAIRRRVAVP